MYGGLRKQTKKTKQKQKQNREAWKAQEKLSYNLCIYLGKLEMTLSCHVCQCHVTNTIVLNIKII